MPRFRVTYAGTAEWSTTYHSTPANPGGSPDTNDAHDSSAQVWSLSFVQLLSWPSGAGREATTRLVGAEGSTRATGNVSHTHVDGLYPADNASVNCRVTASTSFDQMLPASIGVTYLRSQRRLLLTALDPVGQALDLLPQQCPGQGDSLDGLADNYFTPGFSFAAGYGPDRWFRSGTVGLPLSRLQRAAKVTVRLGPAPDAAPPVDCSVPYPAWQRCHTGGGWQGTLTLRRVR
jgi:hypothetical protein